jgi:hypothetical protein
MRATEIANKIIEGFVKTTINDNKTFTWVKNPKIMAAMVKIVPNSFFEKIRIRASIIKKLNNEGSTILKRINSLKISRCISIIILV